MNPIIILMFNVKELCRQRMTHEPTSGRGSKSSSTSSWCEEAITQSTIDISTGHVILNLLQECLADPSKIEAQWETIGDYHNTSKQTTIGRKYTERNRSIIPCNVNRFFCIKIYSVKE
ncbi:hypothetical protein DICVIV_10498 [Dictyocaulus viviparus]|uniref:Uncharacterized protein n=1 Tax=Dictyocaulus viviparus TaxID=29172 RepID=A0A0D8XID3_DICVI|nr:hypothetical protein DICVIV_10498 [Dictyocaulus viviparus]